LLDNIHCAGVGWRWVITPAPQLYERPLGTFTYGDYMRLPNKLSQSTSGPSVVCFDKQVSVSNFYFWPLPTFGGTCNMTVARLVNSIDDPADPLDFPISWMEGLSYIMSDRLMEDEGVAAADEVTAQRITERSVAFYQKYLNYDRPVSVMVRPFGKAGNGQAADAAASVATRPPRR